MIICIDQRTGTGCGQINRNAAQVCLHCARPLRFGLQLLDLGTTVGRYRILSLIGHGGFGAVYEAEIVQRPGVHVALKETFESDSVRSFQKEFVTLCQLHHPNLPRYYEMFESNGNGYLVMDYVPGQSLEDILLKQQGPLAEVQVLGYAVQLCDVLTYLHAQYPPIIHRDIKPANIRLTPEGLIKLVDFGLHKQGTTATASSRRGLTPAYAPLEQWGAGGLHTDARSDVYSLGATFYHLLTGQVPACATDRIADSTDPILAMPMLQLNPQLSKSAVLAITTAISLPPDKRYPDALSFKRALLGEVQTAPALHRPVPATSLELNFQAPVAKPDESAKPVIVTPAPIETLPERLATRDGRTRLRRFLAASLGMSVVDLLLDLSKIDGNPSLLLLPLWGILALIIGKLLRYANNHSRVLAVSTPVIFVCLSIVWAVSVRGEKTLAALLLYLFFGFVGAIFCEAMDVGRTEFSRNMVNTRRRR